MTWTMFRPCIILFLWSLLAGCAHRPELEESEFGHNWKEQRSNGLYQSSGINQFFLPQMPLWVNFSSTASCRRNYVPQYLDVQKMRASFNLSYQQTMHFQYTFNVAYNQERYQREGNYVPMKEEEMLFYQTLDQTQSGIFTFRAPNYPQSHVIWIDPFIDQQVPIKKLKQFLISDKMSKGHPIFFSLCLNYRELEHFLSAHEIQNQNIRLLSYEILSPYNLESNFTTSFQIDLDQLLGVDRKIVVFSPTKVSPMELTGDKISREFF